MSITFSGNSLLTGQVISLIQNKSVALPAKRCLLFTDASAPTLQWSLTATMSSSTTITLSTNNTVELCGGFIALNSSGPINVILEASTD